MSKVESKLFQRSYCSIIYSLNLFALGGIISGFGPLIPFIAQRLDLHETDFGLIFTFRGFGYMAGSYCTSHIDKYIKNFNNFYACMNFLLGLGSYLTYFDLSYL